VRRALVAVAGLVLAVALVATGLGYGADRARYAASNEAILAELPTYPGARLVSTRTLPYYRGDSAWSRVAGYTTLAFFRLPRGTDPSQVSAFYERELADDWTLAERLDESPYAAGPIRRFRRREAALSVNLESWRGGILEIAIDSGISHLRGRGRR